MKVIKKLLKTQKHYAVDLKFELCILVLVVFLFINRHLFVLLLGYCFV